MFQGSERAQGQFDKIIYNSAGINNGSTRFDFTNYYEVVPSNALESVLWVEGDRMRGLDLNPGARQPAGRRHQRGQGQRPQPALRRLAVARHASAGQHQLVQRHNFYGDLTEIEPRPLADAKTFFESFYRPNNAVLVVAGDIDYAEDPGDDRPLFPRRSRPGRRSLPDISEPRQTAGEVQGQARPAGAAPRLHRRLARARARDSPMVCDGDLDQILVQGQDSRLYQKMVRDTGIAGGVQGGINVGLGNMFNYRGPMLWTVAFIHDPAKTREEITAALDSVVEDVRTRPVSAAELERARTKIRSGLYNLADPFDPLRPRRPARGRRDVGGRSQLGEPARGRLRPVTPELLLATAKEYLRPTNRSILLVQPAPPAAGAPSHGSLAMIRRSSPPSPPPPSASPPRRSPPSRPTIIRRCRRRHAQAVRGPASETYRLANGMQVTLIPYGQVPKAVVSLRVYAGSLNEGEDVGLAALTGQMLREAPAGAPARDRRGGRGDGRQPQRRRGTHETFFGLNVLSEHAGDAVRLIADLAQRPDLPASEFERVRQAYARNVAVASRSPSRPPTSRWPPLITAPATLMAGVPDRRPARRLYARRRPPLLRSQFRSEAGAAVRRRPVRHGGGQGRDPAGFGGWAGGPERLSLPPTRAAGPEGDPGRPAGRAAIDRPPRLAGAGRGSARGYRLPGHRRFARRLLHLADHPEYPRAERLYLFARLLRLLQSGRGAMGVRRRRHHRRHRAALKEVFGEIRRLQTEAVPEEEAAGMRTWMAGTFVLQNASPPA
jgi:zinc protease